MPLLPSQDPRFVGWLVATAHKRADKEALMRDEREEHTRAERRKSAVDAFMFALEMYVTAAANKAVQPSLYGGRMELKGLRKAVDRLLNSAKED